MKKELIKGAQKAKEIYARAIERLSFSTDLKVFRKKYNIPPPNEKNKRALDTLLLQYHLSAVEKISPTPAVLKRYKGLPGPEYIRDRIIFLKEYGFPTIGFGDAMDAILRGGAPKYMPFAYTPVEEVVIEELHNPQIQISMDSLATRDELIEYIKKNWQQMQELLRGSVSRRQRLKVKGKRSDDKTIYDYWTYYQKHPEEWRGVNKAIEFKVQEKLKEDGDTRKIEAIKSVFFRVKKRKKKS